MIATLSSNRIPVTGSFGGSKCRSKDEKHPVITCMHKQQGKETTTRHFSVSGICMSLSSLDTWRRMGRTSSYTYNERVALKHTYIAET